MKPALLTLDEIIVILNEIVREGEGKDRMAAIKMLTGLKAASAALPEPVTDAEIIERLARLHKGVGQVRVQLAYRKAFPGAKRPINLAAPKVKLEDMTIDPSTFPDSIKKLYRMAPEIKRAGLPPGYPQKAGLAVKKKWIHEAWLKILTDRAQADVDRSVIEDREPPEPGNAPSEPGHV